MMKALFWLTFFFNSLSILAQSTSIDELLSQMTLQEKIGQMVQINKIKFEEDPSIIHRYYIGSVLSGGGDHPKQNKASSWAELVEKIQSEGLKTRLKIPLLYGIDAVHGHSNVYGATIFPHNISLGATRNETLIQKIGEIVALEMSRTGMHWNFAPAVSVPRDIRWGRTYEGFSENTELVTLLSSAYLAGLQRGLVEEDFPKILGTAKHFVGDGGTIWGTSANKDFIIDQGDTKLSEEKLRQIHLPPYTAAIAKGVKTIMVSYSSWNGKRMHAHKYLLTDVLKGELGFEGFLISDWAALDQIPGTHKDQIVAAINAGVDMIMLPYRPIEFIREATAAVNEGLIAISRINDAVRRILQVKKIFELFEKPLKNWSEYPLLGNKNHRDIARQAVRESLVLLKNNKTLPLRKDLKEIYVLGAAADDLGIQCGGWTLEWQGKKGSITKGTTLLAAIKQTVSSATQIHFITRAEQIKSPAPILMVFGEDPYAEGFGDKADLRLKKDARDLIEKLAKVDNKKILLIYSGRPLIITEELKTVDALVAAWLPGTEGLGLTDVLFGDFPFMGKLSFTWPKTLEGYNGYPLRKDKVLFPYGFGLTM